MNDTQNLTPQQLYQLGYNYYWGKENCPIDYGKAAEYFRLAAEAGHINAQNNLGWCYQYAKGVDQDLTQAAHWYLKAAENGNTSAQFKMAVFCTDALGGIEQNYEQAIQWYLKAAPKGHVHAQFNLAWCYAHGQGTAINTSEAIHWYTKAAEQGHIKAQYNLAHLYYYSKDPLSRNPEEAFRWFHSAAELGHAGAQFMTAVCYTDESGTARDYKAAIDWYIKAAEQEHKYAQFNLAWCCEQAQGVERDLTQAAFWYEKAAKNGHELAPYYLGMCCIALSDHEKAIHWLQIAADKGNADAAQLLQQEIKARKQAASVSKEPSPSLPPVEEPTTDELLLTLENARMEVLTQPIRRGYFAQVKVVIHKEQGIQLVQQEAKQMAALASNHAGAYISLSKKVKLDVELQSPDAKIESPIESLYWNGRYSVCEFTIEVPSDFPKPQIRLTARIYYEQALLQKTTLLVDLSDSSRTYHPTDRKNGSSAFISYAHKDLEKVTGRIHGMWIRDPDYNLFLDIINMRKSEKFEPRLLDEIEKRDLFYLFWSRNAAASEWVNKELNHALKTKGRDAIEIIPLERPDVCPPPKGLEDLNTGNILLYLVNDSADPNQ